MNLTCPKCGHKWDYKGTFFRSQCSKCKTWVRTGFPYSKNTTKTPLKNTTKVSDDFMSGSLIDTLIKKGIIGTKNGTVGTKNGTKYNTNYTKSK